MNSISPQSADPFKSVRYWLYALAVLTAVMILVGGATRLTDSGLSITEWAPISGILPPLNLADWQREFALYQTTEEFKVQNSQMTLEEFKTIYWWEWGHRFLGRLIGLFVLLPMIYFWLRKRLTPKLKLACIGLFLLVSFQGFLGWWMVKSGLVDRVDVSQIRLAIHLTTAFLFLIAIIWVSRSLAYHSAVPIYGASWQACGLILLLLVQIFIGGLLAGLDAGMAYNTWPKMNGEWAPEGLWAISPGWLNLTDNAMTVQFFHRIFAYAIWLVVLLHAVVISIGYSGTHHAKRAWLLFLLVTVQACIGVVTLVMQVPFYWALIHQFGAVVVIVFATAHWRGLNPSHHGATSSASTNLNLDYGRA